MAQRAFGRRKPDHRGAGDCAHLPLSGSETMLAGVSASSRAGSPLRPFVSFGLACVSLVFACSDGSRDGASVASDPVEGLGGSGGAGELAAEPEPCAPAPGTTGSPSTIAETVDLVNGLPKPHSLACFLEALERPLRLVATRSFFSAQLAMGARSPRIFLFMEGIIHSIVPEGSARNLLEMGEATGPSSSIKAELEFPITESITLATAFERLPMMGGLTTCGVCHNGHVPVLGIEGAFESEACALLMEAAMPSSSPSAAPCSARCSSTERSSPRSSPVRSAPSSTDAHRMVFS
jgi:hypothetical protein